MFRGVAKIWRDNTGVLGDIDSRFGDGDHGFTVGKMAALLEKSVDGWDGRGIRDFIETLSAGIMGISGGSAGPLYGTLIEGLAAPLAPETETIDAGTLKAMLAGSLASLREITTAKRGDKTMMDALIPAVEAARKAEGGVADVLAVAAAAASEGARSTEAVASRFGRARSYGDKTIGTPDAGAMSTAMFFEGLRAGFPQGDER